MSKRIVRKKITKTKPKIIKKRQINRNDSDDSEHNVNHSDDNDVQINNTNDTSVNNNTLDEKTTNRLKKHVSKWLDYDDKIKSLNLEIKKIKTIKKDQEDIIINMIMKLGMDETKIDVQSDTGDLRARVYRHKSVTKGPLKGDIIKDALLELIPNEKKVSQLVKKIESTRPLNERYYLKRTKGAK